jgi:hypothetical protein
MQKYQVRANLGEYTSQMLDYIIEIIPKYFGGFLIIDEVKKEALKKDVTNKMLELIKSEIGGEDG